jgi:hypothetical protein
MRPRLIVKLTAWLFLGGVLAGDAGRAHAQTPATFSPDALTQQPRLDFRWYSFDGKDGVTPSTASRTTRLQMSGMQAGFITNPLGIDQDDDLPPGASDSLNRPLDTDPDFVQFAVGTYNPYFDLRLPGDPGGLGYYKVHSQLQIIDGRATSVCLNLQAYTPAGQQVGGLASGPTYFIPAVAGFQDLGYGAALQGYFGQNIQANAHWSDLTPNFLYGMALQYAVPGVNAKGEQGLFLYFEAVGRYRTDPTQASGHTAMWEFVPGVQMRLNSNCWMSLGASRYNFLTAQWRY